MIILAVYAGLDELDVGNQKRGPYNMGLLPGIKMRKNYLFLVLLLISLFIILVVKCKINATKAEEYSRQYIYPCTFNVSHIHKSKTDFYFENDYFSYKQKFLFVQTISNDIKQIETTIGSCSSVHPKSIYKIYIVNHLLKDCICFDDNAIFLDYDSFISGSYRPHLVAYAVNSPLCNKSYGLTSHIFSYQTDNNLLSKTISQTPELLDFFYGRMILENSDNPAIINYQNLLTSISTYIINIYGVDFFWTTNFSDELIRLWLSDLHLESDLLPHELTNLMLQDVYSVYSPDYLMVLANKNVHFCFKSDAELLDSMTNLKNFIVTEEDNRYKIFNFLVNNTNYTPSAYKPNDALTYVISYNQNSNSQAHSGDARLGTSPYIYLNSFDDRVLIHELMHIYIPYKRENNDLLWLSEGIAEYFSWYVLCPEEFKVAVQSLTEDSMYDTGELLSYYYKKSANSNLNTTERDILIIYNYFIYKKRVLNQITEIDSLFDTSISSVYGITSAGFELSYFESISFVDYLVKKYGLNKLLSSLNSSDTFSQGICINYKQLKRDWLASLTP